jgi:hypothetical protein
LNTGAEMPFQLVNDAYTENSRGKSVKRRNPITGMATKSSAAWCSFR